jgi:hypothetical protein
MPAWCVVTDSRHASPYHNTFPGTSKPGPVRWLQGRDADRHSTQAASRVMRPDQEQLDAPLAAALCEAISVGTGSPANIDSLTEITGGSISRALMLASAGERYFVKLNDAKLADMFAAEADGLRALAACPALRVPRVVGYGVSGRQAYLLLEYLPLQTLRTGQQGGRRRGTHWLHCTASVVRSTAGIVTTSSAAQYSTMPSIATWPFFFAHRPPVAAARTGQATLLSTTG